MDPTFRKRVADADGYADLFDLVKEAVQQQTGRSRTGLMLGLAELGFSPQGWIGGYFVAGTNALVLNRDLLNYVRARDPDRFNAYAFHLLCHEYLHSLGLFDEADVRKLVYAICRERLGEDHPATRFADALRPGGHGDVPDYVRDIVHPRIGWTPDEPGRIEFVRGIDPDATPYIR